LQEIISRWRSERSKRAKRERQKYFWRRRGRLSIETLYHIKLTRHGDRAIRAKLGRAKEHVMRPAEFERGEIQIKLRL
jgi:hypothetical protein